MAHYSTDNAASFGSANVLDTAKIAWFSDVASDKAGNWVIAYNYSLSGSLYSQCDDPSNIGEAYIKVLYKSSSNPSLGAWSVHPTLTPTYARWGKDPLGKVLYPRVAGADGVFHVAFRAHGCDYLRVVRSMHLNTSSGSLSAPVDVVDDVFGINQTVQDLEIDVTRSTQPKKVHLLVKVSDQEEGDLGALSETVLGQSGWSPAITVVRLGYNSSHGYGFAAASDSRQSLGLAYRAGGGAETLYFNRRSTSELYPVLMNGDPTHVPNFNPIGLPGQQVPVVSSISTTVGGVVSNVIRCYATTSSWKRTDYTLPLTSYQNVSLWYNRAQANAANSISFSLTPKNASTGASLPVHYIVYVFESGAPPANDPANNRYYYSLPGAAPAGQWSYISRNILRDLESAKGVPTGSYTMSRIWGIWFYQTLTVMVDDIRTFPDEI
ncbi:hypothetical protein GC173_07475 [bacterium]|nr:hypothetical protein [bacterium]